VEYKRTILVVDDASMFLELESLFLARSGRVITARSGAEALELARRERPEVVVTDLDMPGMSGDALCKEIRNDRELRHTPVIAVIASEFGEDRARAVRAGADDIVAKPISRIALIRAVNRFLRAPVVHGLARVSLETEVHIRARRGEAKGWSRNLSRGGIFVEAEPTAPLESEVQLHFQLPDSARALSPTAKVVWSREPTDGRPKGMGLQFLALDRASARHIDEYVYERELTQPDPIPPGAPPGVR
jgi:uncharacterized protein (TIGR02266 family)